MSICFFFKANLIIEAFGEIGGKHMKKFKAFVSIFLAVLCLTTSVGTVAAFAEEPKNTGLVRENEEAETKSPRINVEELDPNIKIVVTEITEDSDVPMPLDLRRTNTYFKFTGGMEGKTRYYQGNHFSVDLTTSCEKAGNFELKLVKTGVWADKTVGRVELPRNGSFHVEFLNIYQPGNYRFDFNQVGWGSYYQTGDMTIWDWD